MKNISKVALLCVGATFLAGCVEDSVYYADPGSGYSSSYQTETYGYNRDYVRHVHPHYNREGSGYSSSASRGYQMGPSNEPVVRGYSSSRSGTSYPTGGGYSSSHSGTSYPVGGGYSSSQSSSNPPANNGGYSSSGSNVPPSHPKAEGGRGLFGGVVGHLPRKMVPAQQEDTPAPSGNTSGGGWSSSAR